MQYYEFAESSPVLLRAAQSKVRGPGEASEAHSRGAATSSLVSRLLSNNQSFANELP